MKPPSWGESCLHHQNTGIFEGGVPFGGPSATQTIQLEREVRRICVIYVPSGLSRALC